MSFPPGIHWVCGECLMGLVNRDRDRKEAKAAADYLERDYAAWAI